MCAPLGRVAALSQAVGVGEGNGAAFAHVIAVVIARTAGVAGVPAGAMEGGGCGTVRIGIFLGIEAVIRGRGGRIDGKTGFLDFLNDGGVYRPVAGQKQPEVDKRHDGNEKGDKNKEKFYRRIIHELIISRFG